MKTDQPEPLDLRSQDIAADKVAQLLRLFPGIPAEGGRLDLERLKLALCEAVDVTVRGLQPWRPVQLRYHS